MGNIKRLLDLDLNLDAEGEGMRPLDCACAVEVHFGPQYLCLPWGV